MASSDRKNKDREMAAYMAAKGITRTSGACPRGCGALISNGGSALIVHLNRCFGSPKRH